MKIELLSCTQNAEEFLGFVAGECYGADVSDPEKNIKRAAHCSNKGHLAVLRFAHAVFRISGISRVCSHQMVRSKHLDFLQKSQRYTKSDVYECKDVILPTFFESEEHNVVLQHSLNQSYEQYEKLLSMGAKKEDARMVLPNFSPTSLNVVGNFQAWLDFIRLRNNKESQYEIRLVAQEIQKQLIEVAPNIFTLN
jgi:thymidylate synthase (FAD)